MLRYVPSVLELIQQQNKIDQHGIRHFSPLTIKTEIVGNRFERKLLLDVSVLIGTFGICQRCRGSDRLPFTIDDCIFDNWHNNFSRSHLC